MAWHIFEKLLESVANYSPFIGKVWITFLFMFRLIMVASIGDTVYSDEQSAFKCNTLQPGCDQVCFNRFSPISQIRFWAFQILLVGTPSVMFIVFAMHRITTLPPSSYKKNDEESEEKNETKENQLSTTAIGVTKRHTVRSEAKTETFSHATHLPQYDEVVYQAGNGRHSKHNKEDAAFLKTAGANSVSEFIGQANFIMKGNSVKHPSKREGKRKDKKPAVTRKKIYMPDTTEIVKTPGIVRAYVVQVLARTLIEVGFLYLQFYLYKFEVKELYLCEGFPCPRTVECFVSRPMEKTLFLRFMYGMSVLSLLLNFIEIYTLIHKWVKRTVCTNSSNKDSLTRTPSDRLPMEEIVIERSRNGLRGRPIIPNTFPDLGPFPRSHDNSFGDSSGDDTMDSDYRFYDI